jgi:hypothetical protein
VAVTVVLATATVSGVGLAVVGTAHRHSVQNAVRDPGHRHPGKTALGDPAGRTRPSVHRQRGKLAVRDPAGGTLLSVDCPSSRICVTVGDRETRSGPRKLMIRRVGPKLRLKAGHSGPRAIGSLLNAVSCPTTDACVAVGTSYLRSDVATPLAETFRRGIWRVVPVPVPPAHRGNGSRLTGLDCLTVKDCFAVGFNQKPGGTEALAEHWNGTKWRIQRTPGVPRTRHSLLTRVSCSSARACTAIGEVVRSGVPSAVAERWNGRAWRIQVVAPIAAGYVLTGIACPAARFCLAVGGYAGRDKTLTEIWNGRSWRTQSAPSPAHQVQSALADVFCGSARQCTAVGYQRAAIKPSRYASLIESWNGRSWHIQASPSRSRITDLYSVSCAGARDCVAVGDYSLRLGLRSRLVEIWNGTRWLIAKN